MRAALLTGDNHHSNHLGIITEYAPGYPGDDGRRPRNQATLAEILKPNGYSTFYVGKWHQTPIDETSNARPFERQALSITGRR